MTAISSTASSANADEHDPAAQTLTSHSADAEFEGGVTALFHKPLCLAAIAADTRECKSELVEIGSKLVQPMATVVSQMAQTLPDMAAYWTAPIVPRDPEADSTPVSP